MTKKTCPICHSPVTKTYTPFCSKRCADLDLGKWLNGAYVIEGEEELSSDYGYQENETYH